MGQCYFVTVSQFVGYSNPGCSSRFAMSIMVNVDSKGVETLKALSVKSSHELVSCLERHVLRIHQLYRPGAQEAST